VSTRSRYSAIFGRKCTGADLAQLRGADFNEEDRMKRQVLTAVCAAVAMTIGLAAQDPASSASRDQSASKDANAITLTGCLAKGDSLGATGTSGSTSPARTTTSAQFVLNNAKMGSAASTTAATPGGTTAGGTTAGAAGTSGASYILDGTESELTRHVGHKVEITGTLDKSASSPSSSAPATTTPPAAGSPSMASAQQHVKVTAIKMVSSSCTN
jgi:hypothetical protein